MAVADGVAGRFKQMILSGQLGPGDRLPPERDLAIQLGVSRNSIREALAALTEVGVLGARVGAGTYVTELHPGRLFESTAFVVDLLRPDRVLDVLAVRRVLESYATSLAATAIADQQLSELDELIEKMTNDSVPVAERIASDVEFHRRICAVSGNHVLAGLLDSVRGGALPASQWRGATDPAAAERMHVEHRMIRDALRERDPNLAATLAAAHVAGIEAWIRESKLPAAVR